MAGGPYNIPRNTKGESRFFYIFSTRALIFTAVLGGGAFAIFYPIGRTIGHNLLGAIMAGIFGIIGFVVSSFKIPDSNNFELTRKARWRIYISDYNEIYKI